MYWLVFLLSTAPFEILGESNNVEYKLGVEGTTLFSIADIAAVFQSIIFYGGFVTAIGMGILLLFTKNNEKLYGERKQAIMHKIFIIWLAASAVSIFNLLKSFLDGTFGF